MAIQNLKKAIEIDKNYNKAYELLAKIYVDREEWSNTIALLKPLTGAAVSEVTYYRLAHAYNATNEFSAALAASTSALGKKSNWAPALVEKGDALKGLGRNKDAVEAYRGAARDPRWKSVSEYRINELTKWDGK